jgi:hypothetical protein
MGVGSTWTVLGSDHLPVGPVEEFLEFLRVGRAASPHTVRSYAAALGGLWSYLEVAGVDWDVVTLPVFTGYVAALRGGEAAGVRRLPVAGQEVRGRAEATVATRLAGVLSFYRYHRDAHGVAVADRLYRVRQRRAGGRYLPALGHTRGGRAAEPAVRVRRGDGRPVPVLTPEQVHAILDDCARPDLVTGGWAGSLRDRLLFSTLAEKGCDWVSAWPAGTATGTPVAAARPIWKWCRGRTTRTGCG